MNDGRVEYTFLWFIENYSWQKNGERLWSPHFTADELEGKSWRIVVCPRGWHDTDEGYISLYLKRQPVEDEPQYVSLKYGFSVLAVDGSTVCSNANKETFGKGFVSGWPQFIKMENISQDNLTVLCRIWKGEGKAHKIPPICARTRIAVENISFLQVVENFSTLESNQKNTIEIRSHSKKGSVVSSSLYFSDDSCCEGEMIVEITSSDSNHILCKRKISLLDVSGNIIACGEDDNRNDIWRKDIRKLPLSLTRQVILSKKGEYLPDDNLSLLCECAFSTGVEFEKIEETRHEMAAVKEANDQVPSKNEGNTVEKASAYPSALEDMEALYVDECLTDVELKTKTKSFPAHKSVLGARSPVFKAMLTHDMKEKYSHCIQVDDLADDIVRQMLLFLYSDKTENLQWNAATQLYFAGDKYQIGKLKEVCSSFLVENLTATNASELLVLADTHSDGDLKKSVEDFILGHEEIFVSKEWEMLMETNSQLAGKTMQLKFKRKMK